MSEKVKEYSQEYVDDGHWERDGVEVEDEKEIARLDDIHAQNYKGAAKQLGDEVEKGRWAGKPDKRFPHSACVITLNSTENKINHLARLLAD